MNEISPTSSNKLIISDDTIDMDSTVNLGALYSGSSNTKHLVHTYSFPNSLLCQKRQKIMSEAEEAFNNKYSIENIASISHIKMMGHSRVKQIGFKGTKLPLISRKFKNTKFRHVITHESILSPLNKTEENHKREYNNDNNLNKSNDIIENNSYKEKYNKNRHNEQLIKNRFTEVIKGFDKFPNVIFVLL